jgi:hypothetical protein
VVFLVSRLELRRFGSICVQLAGQRAILTDITSRRAARLPVERRTTQGAADVSDASHDQLAESSKPDALDPGDGRHMDVIGTARSSPHCPPSMALTAPAGRACRVEP